MGSRVVMEGVVVWLSACGLKKVYRLEYIHLQNSERYMRCSTGNSRPLNPCCLTVSDDEIYSRLSLTDDENPYPRPPSTLHLNQCNRS